MALAMENIKYFTLLGMIMLIGLVAKNAILVVDFANQLLSQGVDVKDAFIRSDSKDSGPIIMTVLSNNNRYVTYCFSSRSWCRLENGLAWVLVGGLTSSSILTLVIVATRVLSFK